MDMNDLRKHFGTQAAAAAAIGKSKQVVSAWNRNGIPLGRQYEIQVLTGGRLRADGPNKPRSRVKNNNSTGKKTGAALLDNGAQA